MAIKKSYITGIVLTIIVIVAAYYLHKPAPAKLPEKIYIGAAMCQTGAFAAPAKHTFAAMRDYWELVNKRGGINGIPVVFLEADNEYKAETTVTIVTEWLAEYPLSVVITCGTHAVAALYPTMRDAGIPYTDPSLAGAWGNATKYPWYFLPPFSSYTDHYRAFLKWFKDGWTEARNPKLAIVWETKTMGPLTKPGVASYAEYIGYDVHDEVVEIGSTEAYAQIERIKDWGADVVATIVPPSETVVVLKNAAERSLEAEFVGFYYSFFWEPLIAIFGPLAEGKYGSSNSIPWGYDVPGMADIIEAQVQCHPGKWYNSTMYVYGWVHSMIIEEALKRAAEAGDLSGEGVKAAWETIEDFDTGGLTPPVTYTSKDHRGTTTVWVWKVESGKFVKVAQVILPREDPWFGK